MKKNILGALALACVLPMAAMADTSLDYLTVKDGGVKSGLEVSKLLRITFVDGKMVAKTESGEQSFNLASLQKMTFTEHLPGDVDGNGAVDAADVTTVKEVVLGTRTTYWDQVAADMDDNGEITVNDLTHVVERVSK